MLAGACWHSMPNRMHLLPLLSMLLAQNSGSQAQKLAMTIDDFNFDLSGLSPLTPIDGHDTDYFSCDHVSSDSTQWT